jgi:hypothetical protein
MFVVRFVFGDTTSLSLSVIVDLDFCFSRATKIAFHCKFLMVINDRERIAVFSDDVLALWTNMREFDRLNVILFITLLVDDLDQSYLVTFATTLEVCEI